MKNLSIIFLTLALGACGKTAKEEPNLAPQAVQDYEIAAGTYTLSSGSVSYSNNVGAMMDPQTMQIVGDYTWTIESKGNNKYVVTQTGFTKATNSNFVDSVIDCRGAQDVLQFELTKTHAVRDVVQISSGCPQGLNLASSANQWSVRSLNNDVFVVTLVAQGGGEKYVYTLTFQK